MTYTPATRRRFLRTLAAAAVGAPILGRIEHAAAAVDGSARALKTGVGAPAWLDALRTRYMLAPGITFLNHASIGTVPRPVHEAHAAYLELCETHPSLYVWGDPWREVTEETRAGAARLLGADPEDLAITHNTTEGFNVLAHGLPLDAGDEVLFSNLNHPGAAVPWERMAARRGFRVRAFDLPLDGIPDMGVDEVVARHVEALGARTRAVVVPHVDNQVGLRLPLAELSRALRNAGVRWVLVDGAQSAGMIDVDLSASGVDAYAMSPHKWIQSPKGLGMFWVAPALRAELPPMWHRTGGSGRGPSARQYEDYSTRAWPAVVALGDALTFQDAIGADEKARRYAALRADIQARVADEPGLRWASPVSDRVGSVIVAVEVHGRSAPEVGEELMSAHGINVRAFGGSANTLRLSPNLATPEEQIHAALDRMAGAAR
ncbi:MAG: aminotransferase class V-fold PLP-dependent enzyme [Longimicrobiales bacterium]